MLEVLLYVIYIAMLCFLLSRFNYNRDTRGYKFKLSLPNCYGVALMMYTAFPIFDCIVNNKHEEYISPFLIKCIILTISLFIGFETSKRIVFKVRPLRKPLLVSNFKLSKENQYFWTIAFTVMCAVFVLIYIIKYKGGLNYILHSNYHSSFGEGSSLAASLIYSVMPYALIFTDKRIITEKNARYIAISFSAGVILLHLLGGNRNLAVMVGLALVWSMFSDKQFRKLQVLIIVIGAVIVMGSFAVFRQYGLWNIITGQANMIKGHLSGFVAHFADGELGTTFAFERNAKGIPMSVYPHRFGYSYFILPWVNLIPGFMLQNKPLTYGVYFKSSLFGMTGTGYGFSPIYEAEINYGYFWWIVFILVGYILGRLNVDIKRENLNAFYNKGIIMCIILNFFRIDFAVCFKLIIMMMVFKSVYLMCLRLTAKRCIRGSVLWKM